MPLVKYHCHEHLNSCVFIYLSERYHHQRAFTTYNLIEPDKIAIICSWYLRSRYYYLITSYNIWVNIICGTLWEKAGIWYMIFFLLLCLKVKNGNSNLNMFRNSQASSVRVDLFEMSMKGVLGICQVNLISWCGNPSLTVRLIKITHL